MKRFLFLFRHYFYLLKSVLNEVVGTETIGNVLRIVNAGKMTFFQESWIGNRESLNALGFGMKNIVGQFIIQKKGNEKDAA